jgi:starvation-inducible DNA-binding protein
MMIKETTLPAHFHVPHTIEDRQTGQAMLIDLIDLALTGKQAHWKVVSRDFRALHRQLDELVDSWRSMADEVAERAVTLGAALNGQAEIVAGATDLDPLPAGHLQDDRAIEALTDRVADVAMRTPERIDRLDQDPVTQDLLIEVAGTLEKQSWMLRAQEPTS